MEIGQIMQGLWGQNGVQEKPHPLDRLAAPQTPPTKNGAFNPQILAEAQTTFKGNGGQNNQGQGTKTPQNGTVGNLIPPGWSSQAARN